MTGFQPRWQKVVGDIWLYKGRTLLTVLAIAISVFAVGMVSHSYLYLIRSSHQGYIRINPTSAFIVTNFFDSSHLDIIRDMPEVEEVEGRRIDTGRIFLGDRWYRLQLSGVDFDQTCINRLEAVAGCTIPQDRELLLDQTAIYLTNFEVGDVAIVEMVDGRRYEMPIAGQVRDLMSDPSFNSGRINAYLTIDTFEWLGQPTLFNRLLFTASNYRDDYNHLQHVTGLVRDELGRSGADVIGSFVFPEPGVYPSSVVIEAIVSILGLMAIVSLGIGVFLVFNTISALLTSQRQQMAVLKVVGASSRDLLLMYLVLVLVYGLCAFAIAVPLAAWATARFSYFLAGPELLDLRLLPFKVPIVVLLMELIVSILVPIAGALPAVAAAVRSPTHEAIRACGLGDKFGNHILDRLLGNARMVNSSWLLCVGAVLRSKKRVLFTLATLILGGAFFGAVTSLKASSDGTVVSLADAFRYDVEIRLARNYREQTVMRSSAAVPGVTAAEGWSAMGAALLLDSGSEGNSIRLFGVPPGTELIKPKIIAGRWLQQGDENGLIVESSLLREYPSLSPGDIVWLTIDNEDSEWKILGIYQRVGIHAGYAAYTNRDYLARLTGNIGDIRQVQLLNSQHDPAFQDQVASNAMEAFQRKAFHITHVETVSQRQGILASQFDILIAVLMLMALLLLIVGTLGLLSTMSISVLERSREMGVLRVLGASEWDVIRIVISEGILLVIISWIAAVFLAWPIGLLLTHVVGRQLLASKMNFTYSFSGMLLWLIIALLAAVAASYAPARHASKLTIRDLLAYE